MADFQPPPPPPQHYIIFDSTSPKQLNSEPDDGKHVYKDASTGGAEDNLMNTENIDESK